MRVDVGVVLGPGHVHCARHKRERGRSLNRDEIVFRNLSTGEDLCFVCLADAVRHEADGPPVSETVK